MQLHLFFFIKIKKSRQEYDMSMSNIENRKNFTIDKPPYKKKVMLGNGRA
jgi:hypothetical protein